MGACDVDIHRHVCAEAAHAPATAEAAHRCRRAMRKLRAELLEARVAPLRLAQEQAARESQERKQAQESAYRWADTALP